MSGSQPYLSIVIVGRNDNYGGDFTDRLQMCIDWNTRWLEEYKIESEIILVNWNPLVDQPDITDQVAWPSGRKYVSYRILQVPASVHEDYVDPEVRNTVPLFEFVAKNAGIRRAVGKYLLCMNADILVHPHILKFISRKNLSDKVYYRANRLDFKKTKAESVESLFDAGFAVFLKGFMYYFEPESSVKWQYFKLKIRNRIRLRWEAFKLAHVDLSNSNQWNVVYHNGGYLAHCLASGDFMLMNRNNWEKMRAYPEYTAISTHTDSLFTIMAYSLFKEKVLSAPVFHQEHERRYGWEDIEKSEKFKRAYDLFETAADDVKSGLGIEKYMNDENWGLGKYELEEIGL